MLLQALLLALTPACTALPAHRGPVQDWPFGATQELRTGRDLYNLGALGAKAQIPGTPPPSAPTSGRRSTSIGANPDPKDEGPRALEIVTLLPGGPAEAAGLQVGDVVIAANGTKFAKTGSYAALAKALSKALANPEGDVVELRVEREGEKSPVELQVAVEGLGKPLAKPASKEARAILAERARTWLREHQDSNGGFAQTLSGTTGAVVQTSLAGLAWIAGGSNLEAGPDHEAIAKARDFLRANLTAMKSSMGDGGNWNQENWGWAHAAIFLGELYEHSPSPELLAELQNCADHLVEYQESSGGWAHGPGGPNALGYTELNIVSGLALSGLGLAKRAGCTVDEGALERAAKYIADSSGGGGVGYSTKDGQAGQGNIGRTAAAWLGYTNLGLRKDAQYKQMTKYVKRSIADVLDGHASLMQHILLAGVAAAAQGGASEKNYWSSVETMMLLAHTSDGSFQPRPWHESVSTGSNSDVTFGEVWTTAAWAIALSAAPSEDGSTGLPAWCGR
ncbi:MAG: PDZ domain-containing protein [Planctomycetes bacterium]|nr:PDZ domain-containing protein [Planctomycetota bacterium]MCB9903852.1 PDZ domain-containing protein [Planctomycetota bacterium]